MKKTMLLFTIICTTALNSMENLSREVKKLILVAIEGGNDIRDTVRTIQAFTVTSKELNTIVNERYGNPAGFRSLMQTLAKKFNTMDTETIAKGFNTPAAQNYLALGNKLINLLDSIPNQPEKDITSFIDEINTLVKQGADINFMKESGYRPLEIVTLLLCFKMEPMKVEQLLNALQKLGAVPSGQAERRMAERLGTLAKEACVIS